MPLDRAPADAGGSDDTRATARALPRQRRHAARISPEGDADWYQFAASTAGWYAVRSRSTPRRLQAATWSPRSRSATRPATSWPRRARRSRADRRERPRAGRPGEFFVEVTSADGAALLDEYDDHGCPGRGRCVHADGHAVGRPATTVRSPSGDVTGDGRGDVVRAPTGGSALRVYAGQARRAVAASTAVPLPSGTLTGLGIAGADVNGDGRPRRRRRHHGRLPGVHAGGRRRADAAGRRPPWRAPQRVVPPTSTGTATRTSSSPTARAARRSRGTTAPGRSRSPGAIPSSTVIAVGDVTRDGRAGHRRPGAVLRAERRWLLRRRGRPARRWDRGNPRTVAVADVTGDGVADVRPSERGQRRLRAGRLRAGEPDLRDVAPYPAVRDPRRDHARRRRQRRPDGRRRRERGGPAHGPAAEERRARCRLRRPSGSPAHATAYQAGRPDGRPTWTATGTTTSSCRTAAIDVLRTGTRSTSAAGHGWVEDVTPAPHSAGVAVRPDGRRSRSERDAQAGAVTRQTVRLIDGATGAAVAATPTLHARRRGRSA